MPPTSNSHLRAERCLPAPPRPELVTSVGSCCSVPEPGSLVWFPCPKKCYSHPHQLPFLKPRPPRMHQPRRGFASPRVFRAKTKRWAQLSTPDPKPSILTQKAGVPG